MSLLPGQKKADGIPKNMERYGEKKQMKQAIPEGSGLARAILADELLDVLEQPHPLVGRCARAGIVMDGDASALVVPDRRYKEDGADLRALVFPKLMLELLHQPGCYFPDLRLIYWHLVLLQHSLTTSSTLYAICI